MGIHCSWSAARPVAWGVRGPSGSWPSPATRDMGPLVVGDFRAAERRWIDRLENLRNVIRQEVLARQLATLMMPNMSVLDVGCGQGTQALRLASNGCRVTGIDPSPELLALCADAASSLGLTVDLLEGRIEHLDDILGGRTFDLVCCHGVLMYLDDRGSALEALGSRLSDGGSLSVTLRNAHALAMRPGLRRQWVSALEVFASNEYVNELGLVATADRIEEIEAMLGAAGLQMTRWYGVRVFNDAIPAEADPPGDEELSLLLAAEEKAGATDPYRWVASQLHVMAGRGSSGPG